MNEQVLSRIRQLIQRGFLSKSRCGASFLETVRPLIDADVLAWERGGAGGRLVVRDAVALGAFTQSRFPGADDPAGLNRVSGVGRFRDSKSLPGDTPQIVCVRAFVKDLLLCDGRPAGALEATQKHGLFSFLLRDAPKYTFEGSCAIVENPAVFARFEMLRLVVPLVIYGGGRVSNRLIEWLDGAFDPDYEMFHLPDYDPVGMSEYQRLSVKLGGKIQLHVPPDLEERFERYSNPELLANPRSQAILAALRDSNTSIQASYPLMLIDRFNAGLEQEALLLPM